MMYSTYNTPNYKVCVYTRVCVLLYVYDLYVFVSWSVL